MTRILAFLIIVILTVSCKGERSSEPTSPFTKIPSKSERSTDTLNNLIRVENPLPGQLVNSPLEITGQARGFWYFEAEATAELLDENLVKISETNTTAIGEWMTEDWVPFSGTMYYEKPETKTGFLVMHKANASGLKAHNMSDTIPVKFRR